MIAVFGVGQVLESMLWFFLFFIWIMLLLSIFGDVFDSRDLSGVAKFLWVLVVLLFPYLGVFAYLILRGGKMHEHSVQREHEGALAFRDYKAGAAGSGYGTAGELDRLADLRQRGVISEEEFTRLKAKAIG